MKTIVTPVVVGVLGTVKKGMVENKKKVSEAATVRDLKDLHAGICANPQKCASCTNKMIDLSD